MTRAVAAAVTLFLVASCGGAQSDPTLPLRAHGVTAGPDVGGWRAYTSTRGYHFSLPGVPEARSDVRQYNIGAVPTSLFEVSRDDDGNVFVLTVFDARALAHDDAEVVYRGITDEAREHGTLRSEHEFELADGAATEMEFDEPTPGRHARIRVSWLGGFVVRAVAIWNDGLRRRAEEDRFIGSIGVAR